MMAGVNAARGEVLAEIGGERARACLTLGALAEIETGLALDDGEMLSARLHRARSADLTLILAALLRGGGTDADRADALADRATPREAAAAIVKAFEAAAG